MRTSDIVDDILKKLPNENKNYLKSLCGLPISPYFSALKLKWLLDNVPKVQQAVANKRCMFGTVDSWLIWVGKLNIIYIKINHLQIINYIFSFFILFLNF